MERYGEARISNSLGGFDLLMHLNGNGYQVLIPYFDMMAGLRYMGSDLAVTSDDNKHSSDTILASITGLRLGIEAGLLCELSNYIDLQLGLAWDHCFTAGRVVELRSANKTGSSLYYCTTQAPQELLIIKLGLLITIEDEPGASSYHHYYHGHSSCHSSHSGGSHISMHSCSH